MQLHDQREEGSKMKVRIYVQHDLTALIVPLDDADKKLSPDKESMKASATKIRDTDLDDSIIGVDRAGAKHDIQNKGDFVNKIENHS